MTLSDFATITTAVSGIAVTVSIVYLALQTHQNVKHTRALINQGRVTLIAEMLLTSADPEVAAAYLAGTGREATQDAVRKMQFEAFATAQMFGWQDSFSQHERGLLDDDIYKAMRASVTQAMRHPAFREAYEVRFRTPGTKFCAFIDDAIANSSARE
ncbi:MAG TPA: hypothetical protein VHE09_01540 [Rhizomicrobium sp.]|nr:hypothetical protein [Rhizomicrobium sp.]